ncbi:hypothetical protein TSAR_012506 [Trichomalopsis sarcophagae]|uniref:Uncharacterized protein n=1 Tax=Trichomalopsis sarcophagae TaxID=543379 RepID=A0A232ESF5_9HYME|nr:hypothetical protein TSAR_012506 [Trichomalopsis sarcophagae]
MDQASTASSFYETPIEYDEEKTRSLYEKLRTNFHDIQCSLEKAKKDLQDVQKESLLTMKLIRKIETAKRNSNKSEEN